MLRIVITVLLFSFSIVVNGELYKWVDNHGNTQYTDQPPPPGVAKTEKKLKIKSAPPVEPTGDKTNKTEKTKAPKSLAEKELDFKKRRLAEEQAEIKQRAETKEKKDKCIQARSKLKLYQEAPKLTVSDGAGGIIRADDAARQKGIDEAQKEIETYCK